MKELKISDIRLDGGTQIRKELDQNRVDEYLEQMKEGAVFPPVTVFFDGSSYWLASGFHRYFMHKKAGRELIGAIVKEGTLNDAIIYGAGDNKHGLNMNAEDYRRAIIKLLELPETKDWPNTKIAKHIGVSSMTVGRVKKENDIKPSEKVTYTDKHGNEATMKPSYAGRPKEEPQEETTNEKPYDPTEDKMRELMDTITSLADENTLLRDKIALGQWDASEIEKIDAEETIANLREQIRILEIDNAALRESRDMFQNRNAELIKTVNSLKKKLKKGE